MIHARIYNKKQATGSQHAALPNSTNTSTTSKTGKRAKKTVGKQRNGDSHVHICITVIYVYIIIIKNIYICIICIYICIKSYIYIVLEFIYMDFLFYIFLSVTHHHSFCQNPSSPLLPKASKALPTFVSSRYWESESMGIDSPIHVDGCHIIWVFPKIVVQNRGKPPKWMVKIMESPLKMDDLGRKPPSFWKYPSKFPFIQDTQKFLNITGILPNKKRNNTPTQVRNENGTHKYRQYRYQKTENKLSKV